MRAIYALCLILALMAMPVLATTSLEVPAVDAEGIGILSTISVTATSGTGDIFVSIVPLTGIDTQHSEKTAVDVAASELDLDASKFNVMFKIESTAEVVDGTSAGGAMALLAYSEFSGKKMRRDMTMTGSIDADGHIGKIGGVFEKAKAVAESTLHDYNLFLIPRGQRIQSGVDIAKYAKEKWKLQVVEVDNIQDVIDYAFNTAEGSEVKVTEKVVPPLLLIPRKASEEARAFSQISQNEIKETRKRLQASDASVEVKAQVEEMLNLSESLIAKNYFYSAANTAFIATITLDELSFVNNTKKELREKLNEMKAGADDLEFANQTEFNFEWVIGAKLRYHWAKDKIASAEDKVAVGNYMGASGDMAVASSWLRAANRMNEIASQKAIGREMKDIYYREYASQIIGKAKQLQEDGLLDEEAQDHYKTAVSAFSDADYLAAAFDATFATSYSEALDETEDKTFGDVIKGLCGTETFEITCGVFKDKEFGSLWAELYHAHAIYSFQEGNRSNDGASLLNGMKLLRLSDGFELARKEALDILNNPPVVAVGTKIPAAPTKEVKVEVVAVQEDSMRNFVIFGIVGLVILLVVYGVLMGRGPPAVPSIEGRGKIERAEQLLLEGRISERSFEYFKKKYGREKKAPKKSKE